MEQITTLLNAIPDGTFYVVAVGLVVSILLQVFKHWLQLQSDKVITFLLMCLSFISVAIDFLTQTVAQNPTAMGAKTFLIMGVSTTLYRYIVKPVTGIVQDAKVYRDGKVKAAESTTVTAGSSDAPEVVATPVTTAEAIANEFAAE